METGSSRGDVKAAMTFILGGRADHGRPGPGPTRAEVKPCAVCMGRFDLCCPILNLCCGLGGRLSGSAPLLGAIVIGFLALDDH